MGRMRVLEDDLGTDTFNTYFSRSMEDSESNPIFNRHELHHLIYVSSVNARWWASLREETHVNRLPFKEPDANWLLFYPIAEHIESLPSNVARGEKITFKQ